jgi:hypothetical protein
MLDDVHAACKTCGPRQYASVPCVKDPRWECGTCAGPPHATDWNCTLNSKVAILSCAAGYVQSMSEVGQDQCLGMLIGAG